MTSDMMQNKYAAEKAAPLSRSLQDRLELTRHQAFLDGRHDIFDLLTRAPCDDHLKALESISGADPLTGLLNGQAFSQALRREIARTNRGYSNGGLLVIFTLENLCAIQNEHSGEAACLAIKLVAQALETEIRDMDLAARTQEDEFVLLFTDTDMGQALGRLQNMALHLNRLSFIQDGKEIRLSLSLGLKSYEKGAKAGQIFKDASDDLQRNRKGPVNTSSART